jgi:hypothetical protein
MVKSMKIKDFTPDSDVVNIVGNGVKYRATTVSVTTCCSYKAKPPSH